MAVQNVASGRCASSCNLSHCCSSSWTSSSPSLQRSSSSSHLDVHRFTSLATNPSVVMCCKT